MRQDALTNLSQNILPTFLVSDVAAEVHTKGSIDLEVDESWGNDAAMTVNHTIRHNTLLRILLREDEGDHLEEEWAWANDDAIPHPEVVSN